MPDVKSHIFAIIFSTLSPFPHFQYGRQNQARDYSLMTYLLLAYASIVIVLTCKLHSNNKSTA